MIEVSKIRNHDLRCDIDVAHCYFVEASRSYSLYYLGWAEVCCCISQSGLSNKDLFLVHAVHLLWVSWVLCSPLSPSG